jgi:hypothetical protein
MIGYSFRAFRFGASTQPFQPANARRRFGAKLCHPAICGQISDDPRQGFAQANLEFTPHLACKVEQDPLTQLQTAVVIKPAPGLHDQITVPDLNKHDLAQMRLQFALPTLAQHAQPQSRARHLLMVVQGAPATVKCSDRCQLRRGLPELPGNVGQHCRRDHLHRIERQACHTHITNLDSNREPVGITPVCLYRRQITFPQRKKTARRVEERLQDVPISITVFNQQQISNRNIVAPEDLALYTPSLSTNGVTGRENTSYSIRGFTQEINTSPSVAVYFADVVAPRGGSGVPQGDGAGPGSFYDLQNVQVLKGPQGTLFGRNTTGGAVLLVPQKPTSKFGGYIEGL